MARLRAHYWSFNNSNEQSYGAVTYADPRRHGRQVNTPGIIQSPEVSSLHLTAGRKRFNHGVFIQSQARWMRFTGTVGELNAHGGIQ